MGDSSFDVTTALEALAYPSGPTIATRYVFTFAEDNAYTGEAIYVTADDEVVVNAFCSVAGLTLYGTARLLTADGYATPTQSSVNLPSDGSMVSLSIPMNLGYLVSVTLSVVGGTFQRGQVYTQGYLQRFATSVAGTSVNTIQLFAGYADQGSQPGWPGTWFESTASGLGCVRIPQGTTPAAGANISETCPTLRRWRVHSITFTLTTSSQAGTRNVKLVFNNASLVSAVMATSASVGPSSTQNYSFLLGQGSDIVDSSGSFECLPLVDSWLISGGSFGTANVALQSLDQFSAPIYTIEEWIRF